jgi:(E)-4-hydroxy-3-methylbut-2-enyl-diphosphate synthase
MLLDQLVDGIRIQAPALTDEAVVNTGLAILQAARQRFSKTEYIACPSCGRTLFDLSTTLAQIKAATSHLKGLKIGVMGCIVNGPGEMADADYGYVGAGPGRVSLYKGKTCIERNIPADEAVARLLKFIEDDRQQSSPEQ